MSRVKVKPPSVETDAPEKVLLAVRFQAFTFSHIESTVRGDIAYDVGTYELRLALPDGRVSNDTGKYVVILKQSAGAWKATYAIYNSNAMPAGVPVPDTDRE